LDGLALIMELIRRIVSALYGLGILVLSAFIIRYNIGIGELAQNAPLWTPVAVCALLVLFAAAVDRAYALVAIVATLNLGIFSLLLVLIVRLDYSMFSEFRTWGAVALWAVPLVVLIVLTVSGRARRRPD
jgi:hypothetical protein